MNIIRVNKNEKIVVFLFSLLIEKIIKKYNSKIDQNVKYQFIEVLEYSKRNADWYDLTRVDSSIQKLLD